MRSSKMYSHKASHAPLINRQLSVCFPLCYFFLSLLFLTDRLCEISSYYNQVQFFCQERIFFVLFANLFVIICMPYGDYGQENLFCHHIPFSGRFTMWMRVFQAVSLSYTLANRRLVSCLTLYTLFQVLHGLHEGIGIPFCTLIPFPHVSGLFPRVQQAPSASYALVCLFAIRIRTIPDTKVRDNFRLVKRQEYLKKENSFLNIGFLI